MTWRTQAEDSVGWDSSVATCGCATGFALKAASGVLREGREKWAFQSDATSSKIVSSMQHKDLRQEVSLCGARRGEPVSSVCCKVRQVRAVCCESVEQEELAGRPENKAEQKCWLINSLRFYCKIPCEFTRHSPPTPPLPSYRLIRVHQHYRIHSFKTVVFVFSIITN